MNENQRHDRVYRMIDDAISGQSGRQYQVNRAAIDTINARRPKEPIRRLQVWAERTRLTEDGPVPVAQLILSDYTLPDTEDSE